jgi:hypothetical protein
VDSALAGGAWATEGSFFNPVNHAPSAQTLTITRKPSVAVKIALSDLAAKWSDPDGDPVAFVSAAAASANGVAVHANGTYICYDAGANPSQNVTDSFSYTITDQPPNGISALTATGTVTIQVDPGTQVTHNIVSATTTTESDSQLTFAGIPGQTYRVQRATSLTEPVVWTSLQNNGDHTTDFVAGPNGQFSHIDLGSHIYPTRYYRTTMP